ncbi:MAG TPA: alpha/beta hydrolase-fold protein [Thermoanaerobaculia bacterium]|nr:alpha/beta hydrolase-fold protein [Thermoanaerobaculia bacterium]
MSPRLQVLSRFRSHILSTDRAIRVYLPPGYDGRKKQRYPVLYMNDGQNLFESRTAFGGVDWKLGATADTLIAAGAIKPVIIVGIDNTGEKRIHEYTPTSHHAFRGSGRADRYGRMLVEELKPMIDLRYRTLPQRENHAIGGSSLGALVALYVALSHSDVFSKVAVLSPSVWWHDRVIVQQVAQLPARLPLDIWLDMGTTESAEGISDARLLRDALTTRGWVSGTDLVYHEVEGGSHNERAWGTRAGDVLRFLFPRV